MSNTLLWKSFKDNIEKKYSILTYINLVHYDYQIEHLFESIKKVYKNQYNSNEKIVILHYDTDFYITKHIGNTMYNLLQIINYFGISPSVFIILTSNYGLDKELKYYYQNFVSNFDVENDWFNVIENNYSRLQSQENIETNLSMSCEKICYHYSLLNGAPRTHRKILVSALYAQNLIDKGIVSWMFQKVDKNDKLFPKTNIQKENTDTSLHFLTTVPFSRINDKWPVNYYFDKCLKTYEHVFEKNYQHKEISGEPNADHWNLNWCQKAFLQVITETVFDYPREYFTEKTIRNFLLKRPFVVVGAPGTLKILQQIGFKTFNDFWDEEYDNEQNPSLRIEKISKIIKHICSKNIVELQSLCYDMQSILEYNFDYYTTNYAKTRVERLIHEL